MTEDNSAEDVPVTFSVKSSSDAKYTLTLPSSTTVSELKEKLSTKDYADLPAERQRLIYSGRVLKDPDTIGSYKIKDGHTVHLVKGAASNQRQTQQSTGASSSPAAPSVPSLAAGTGNNPLAGLTGGRYAGFAQLPSQDMFGPDGGMGPPPDPEDMIRMMQNPQFASTMNEALANPQLIDMMIQQNPLLRDMGPQVRQMLQTPEFRRMMTDPEHLRVVMQMQRMLGGGGGGGLMGGPGGAGAGAFPAPGVTDTTAEGQPGQAQQPQQQQQQPQQQRGPPGQPAGPQPPNPMAALFGAAGAAGAGQGAGQGQGAAANPFAALFNPAMFGGQPSAANQPGTAATTVQPPAAGTTDGVQPQTAPQGQQQPGQQQPGQQQGQRQAAAAPPNPFGNLGTNPLLQNPQMLMQFLSAMNQNQATARGDQAGGDAQNPLATLLGQAMAGGAAGTAAGAGNPFGMGGGAPAPPDNRPPEERYAEQLRQLNDMGFFEFERNVEALRRAGGSVQGAVEYLLTPPGS